MDGLTDEQRVEAWKSAWEKSLVGMAIVKEDGEFLSVNPQWVKMLGVPATEFYGSSFQDITPKSEVRQDEAQAKLVAQGMIDSYEMDKVYEFSNGHQQMVRLLVTRVPLNTSKPFMYFLSRIVLRKGASVVAAHSQPILSMSDQMESSQGSTLFFQILNFLTKYWVWIATATAALFGAANEFFHMGFF